MSVTLGRLALGFSLNHWCSSRRAYGFANYIDASPAVLRVIFFMVFVVNGAAQINYRRVVWLLKVVTDRVAVAAQRKMLYALAAYDGLNAPQKHGCDPSTGWVA